ncbi:MAG: hypothetical protein ACLSF3_06815 [Anaerobutyricum hallii]|jgi:hypothetical protein|uniref:hypothetical protein n=1 Tax=Clostridia TaxID=186801 RepID=UPI000AE4984A|nr:MULTISPECIES: hypothetical protein [Roseburia]
MTTVTDNDTSMKVAHEERGECTPTFEKECGAASMMPASQAGYLMDFKENLFSI